jgi:Zn-dependent protease
MGPSLQIMRVLGIPIKLHWTFVLMLPLGMYLVEKPGIGGTGTLFFGLLFFLISICVILHEYGHALAARYYGIPTDDIILSPLFGVARIRRLPETPRGEFWVAFAGPLVNILIGLVLLVYLLLASPDTITLLGGELYKALIVASGPMTTPEGLSLLNLIVGILVFVNLGLVVFNLIPAFPMDGGRMLRAWLHQFTKDKSRATWIAAKIGQAFSVLLAGVSLYYGSYIMAFLGVFIYYMALKEHAIVKNEVFRARFHVGEMTREGFTRLDGFSTMSEVAHLFLRGLEKDFLVFDQDGALLGVLTKARIIKWLRKEDSSLDNDILQQIITDFPRLHTDMKIDEALRCMREHHLAFLPVEEDGELIGVIDRQGIFDYVDAFRQIEPKAN